MDIQKDTSLNITAEPLGVTALDRSVQNDFIEAAYSLRNELSTLNEFVTQRSSIVTPTVAEAKTCSTYSACTDLIARVMGKLALRVVDAAGDPVTSNYANAVVDVWNNTALGPARTMGWIVDGLMYQGNAYLYMEGTTRPTGLIPVMAKPILRNGQLTGYKVTSNGALKNKTVAPDSILHFTTENTKNGIEGIAPFLGGSRRAVALSLLLDQYAADSFGKDIFSRLLIVDKASKLTPKSIDALIRQFENKYTGVQSRSRPVIVDTEADVTELTNDARKAQLVETRIAASVTVCRTLGVPPVLVGHENRGSIYGAGIRAVVRNFYNLRVSGQADIIAQEVGRKMLPEGLYADFDATRIVSFDRRETAEIHRLETAGKQVRTQDEARKESGLDPKGGEADELSTTPTGVEQPPSSPGPTGGQQNAITAQTLLDDPTLAMLLNDEAKERLAKIMA